MGPARLISAFGLVSILGAGLAAQEEPVAEFEGLVEVSEVLLDVLAVDRQGRTVRGLGKDDFIVKERGRRVELTGVSFYTTRYGDAAEGDAEIPSSRFFILYFHDQRLLRLSIVHRRHQLLRAGQAAHDWVRDAMSPSDWVAVVGHGKRLHVYQDFTQDRETLMAAIAEAAAGKGTERATPSEWKRLAGTASPFALRRGLPPPPELGSASRNPYEALRLVAEATRPIVGRKNLLLFTLGFGDYEGPNLESRPDYRFYPAMVQAFNDNNVAIYPIDLAPYDVVHMQGGFFRQLATDTGGRYYAHPIRFETRLARIAAENVGYYLLSYRTTHPADESGYRRVTVRAADPHVRVRARGGYRYGI